MTTNSLVRVSPSMFTESAARELVRRNDGIVLGVHSVPDDLEQPGSWLITYERPGQVRRFLTWHRFDGRLEVLALVD